jgi:hypothetical protein
VRPLAERLVVHRRRLAQALDRRERLTEVVGGNGGDVPPRAFAEVQAEVEAEAAGVTRCVEGIHELGGQVKDLDRGLVDFPALREGEEVLLCWQVGEDEIGHWHYLGEGFAGRHELPF